jgi:crossover junction endodeoxyribonuclease RuvC
MIKTYIGIDPGATGAIAVLDEQLKCVGVHDMPVMQLGTRHQQVNAAELARIIQNFTPETLTHVYLEAASAMPGQGVTSMFNFGMGYGVVQGVCGALQLPLSLVRPNAWKKVAGLINLPKEAARTLAQQLYPEQDLSLKKHVGRADALLIARFGIMI